MTPPTRACSEGGSVNAHGKRPDPTDSCLERGWGPGVLTHKNSPPTRVWSEGGSVKYNIINNSTDSRLERGWSHGCICCVDYNL